MSITILILAVTGASVSAGLGFWLHGRSLRAARAAWKQQDRLRRQGKALRHIETRLDIAIPNLESLNRALSRRIEHLEHLERRGR